ncbi:succinylglutamate desuccinylase [Bosea sp. LC85]|uniref:succinylglutamate desuccinylase/aspartoacylase family protein n=1 Tax=Bosea sp. LC85 TaxID=1502851 RepID=UPI0004E38F04|nr:succinylglutamate desuccinylase/aspartoacylase family protein [Bosea sp. LC85]KFC65266.1 succinylglutamate desuccinylase [Bosea sp. LC85]
MAKPMPHNSAPLQAAAGLDDGPLESIRFTGLAAGPKLIVLGAVHGNETCGPNAIRRVIEECRSGKLVIRRGEVTFLPIANPKAYRLKTREGDRNLNRDMREKPLPANYEDRIGNHICALLRQHEVLLDVHSFRGAGEPFVFFGPQDNRGELEPFRQAQAEGAFAACLGVPVVIHGWLDNYARLIAAREKLDLPRLSVTEGYGTTEYMRFAGGYGVTLECGSHDDPASIEVGYAAILNALAHLGLVDAPAPATAGRTVIHITQVIICEAEGDKVEGDWKTGDALAKGQVIARRANGEAVTAPEPGFIIFPNATAKPGEGICYFGVKSTRTL